MRPLRTQHVRYSSTAAEQFDRSRYVFLRARPSDVPWNRTLNRLYAYPPAVGADDVVADRMTALDRDPNRSREWMVYRHGGDERRFFKNGRKAIALFRTWTREARATDQHRATCEAYGWAYVADSDWIEGICGERDGIVHLPTLEGRERHNDTVFETWAACYDEAVEPFVRRDGR